MVNDLGLRRVAASEWRLPNEPRPKKPRRFQSKKKVMLMVFMDYRGVVHHEFLPEGQTVNREYNLDVMRRLREAIRQKRPNLAPCDFFLFGRLKKPLRGTRYSTRDEVMEQSKMALMAIPQTDYRKCFEDSIKRWHKCVAVDGEYFEGDNIDYDE